MDQRPAVVLLNLGGPDSLDAVRPVLYNLFSDPDIFRLPLARLTQRPFAALVSRRRTPEAAKGYAAIGGRSPLLENTQAQAHALQAALAVPQSIAAGARAADSLRRETATALADVYICMRYWHPMAPDVVAMLKERGYRRVILLPLYPQYSLTTTGSSANAFERECKRQNFRPEVHLIRSWYDQPAYQDAIVATLKRELAAFPDPNPERVELLLSAHGLPRKIVDAGDPYEKQIVATAAAVRLKLGWPHVTLCYQSRVGPLEWLKPYTEGVIREKGRGGARQMLVYPIAFVSDHVETLYELGQVYADLARECGIAHYRVAPALNTDPLLIDTLRTLVIDALN
ncbi:MAG: ferrochelatase [Sulfurifustaceae bacterium]